MCLLPCRPKPQPDELFSSWLIRLSRTYCLQFCDFLQMVGLARHLNNSDIDRIASDSLVRSVCKVTGTDPIIARATLLRRRMSALHNDRLRIDTPEWPWLIPIGRSHRSGAIAGFQFCPLCLNSSEPYFRWQWRIALNLLLPSASRPARRPLPGVSSVDPCISPRPVGTPGRPTNGISAPHGTLPELRI